eukprot:gene11972-biopygen9938
MKAAPMRIEMVIMHINNSPLRVDFRMDFTVIPVQWGSMGNADSGIEMETSDVIVIDLTNLSSSSDDEDPPFSPSELLIGGATCNSPNVAFKIEGHHPLSTGSTRYHPLSTGSTRYHPLSPLPLPPPLSPIPRPPPLSPIPRPHPCPWRYSLSTGATPCHWRYYLVHWRYSPVHWRYYLVHWRYYPVHWRYYLVHWSYSPVHWRYYPVHWRYYPTPYAPVAHVILAGSQRRHVNCFSDDTRYSVHSIVDVKMRFGNDCVGIIDHHYLFIPMFRVRWKSYTEEHDTWEPVDDLLDLQVFSDFMRSDTWVAFVKENADAVKGFTITNAFERAMAYDRIDVALQMLDLTVPGSFNYDALLTQSVIGGHTDLVRAIVQTPRFAAGTIPNSGDSELLIEAAENGHTEIVRILLEAPVNPAHANCQGGRALVPAAAGGHTEIVRLLLESPQHAARADCQRGLALVEAAEGGHMEVARLLLSAPIHPARADCLDGLALEAAARGGHIEVAKLLIGYPEHAARADCKRGRVLVEAAEGGHIETVRLLLSAPIHPARADCLNGLALIEAAWGGHIEVAKLLIGYPDHPAHADCQRGRALASAAGEGHIDTVRLLMEAPAHHARADDPYGALLRAAYGGHTEVVRLLLSAPVYPARADDQMAALLRAAEGGHTEVTDDATQPEPMSESDYEDQPSPSPWSQPEPMSDEEPEPEPEPMSDDEPEPEPAYQPAHTFEDVAGLLERTGILETHNNQHHGIRLISWDPNRGIVPMSISYMNRTVHVLRSDMAPDIVIKLQSLSNHTGRVWTENADGITVFTPELSVHDTTDVTTIKAARVENTYIIEINRQLFQFADCDTTCIESILYDVEPLLLRPHQCLTAAEESIVISDGWQ